ncbi:uncharacterized protein LOC111618660 [Centruroides sculpturatus]|nr:uncharacterized protein LOC111618660 [Centruroides sculpturatus]
MSCREDKLQELRRQRREKDSEEGEEREPTDETSTFIEVSSNDLSKTPEKGILKHQEKDKWSDEASQSDNQEVTQLVNNIDGGDDGLTEVERTLKTLNGYHEEILEALQTASSYRSGESGSATPQDEGRDESPPPNGVQDEDGVQSGGPIRIRNLEDLLCQLEQHPDQQQQQQQQQQRHVSPTLSEEIRLSVPEADRQYLLERKDISDMAKHHLETGLGYLLGHIQPPSANTKSPRYSRHVTPEEEEADDSADDDDEGSTFSSHHLVRSASEEALPVTGKPGQRQPPEAVKRDGRDYFPSPPSEDSYANSSEDNAFIPPPSSSAPRPERTQKSQPTTPTPAQSTAHPAGVKRKAKKKFPEYKV